MPVNMWPEASLLAVRSYEVIGALLFLGGLIWIWRSRNPLYVGTYLGSSIGGGIYEWIFDSRYYFRLTTDEKFIPAWTMDGVEAPLAMILFYAFFFGIPLLLLVERHEALVRRLGPRGLYVMLAVLGIVGTPAFECLNTSVTHIYHYHQRPEHLFYGMPYSNFWFGALMFICPYWGLVQARRILGFPQTPVAALAPDQRRLAIALGFAAIITGFFVAASINGVWYVWAEPWIDSPRPF